MTQRQLQVMNLGEIEVDIEPQTIYAEDTVHFWAVINVKDHETDQGNGELLPL